jgi:hypothetical protein
LEGRGKNHVFPWQGSRPSLSGKVPIAKIHGSLSWADGVRYTDGRCGLRGKADIIPPVPEKTADPRHAEVWGLAKEILGLSRDVLVFGFAFNPYDEALLGLLATGQRVRRVLLVDPMPQIERAQRVWPGAKISGCPPPNRTGGELTGWLAAG